MIYAFTDAADGYYQVDVADVAALPEWTQALSACAVRDVAAPMLTIKQKLDKLDAENTLTQRNLRETIMLMAEAFKVVSNNAIDLSQVRGVSVVLAVEAEAIALRAQL